VIVLSSIVVACAPIQRVAQPVNLHVLVAQECARGSTYACSLYRAGQTSPNPPEEAAWWQAVRPAEDEIFIGVTTDENRAYLASKQVVETRAGTKVVFVREEDRRPDRAFGTLSLRETVEIDCRIEKYRFDKLDGFSERGLSGRLTFNVRDPTAWSFIVPGAVIGTIGEKACSPDQAVPRYQPASSARGLF